MAQRNQHLFEELGLLEEIPAETNPYETLGLDPAFMQDLLREESSGSTVQIVAGGMYRTLSRIFHTDAGAEDSTRFRDTKTARSRIEAADPSQLERWAKVERVASSIKIDRIREESNLRLSKTAELVRQNMELGHNPEHFSQMQWSQGVLLHHNQATLLLRAHDTGVEVVRADKSIPQSSNSFHQFMREHHFFGIEPGTRIATYINEIGRASILRSDLRFMMDITDPVQQYLAEQERNTEENENNETWIRATSPRLLTSQLPGTNGKLPEIDPKLIVFPDHIHTLKTKWHIPFTVSGSVTDPNFYKRIRHSNSIGATAISSSAKGLTGHFNVVPTTVQEIADHDAGYSPLVTPGSSLVLYDDKNQMPIITDARILGLLGNGPQCP